MPVAMAIGGAAVIGYLGSQSASRTAAGAANRSTRAQTRMYNQMRDDLEPYREAGLGGLAGIQSLLNDPSSILDDPAYKFNLAQGQEAITGKAAAGGTLQSGATLKDLTRFGQGLATSTYQQQIQNQMGLANLGVQGASQGAASGAAMGSGIGGSIMQSGAFQGAGAMGGANAMSGGLQDYAKFQMMQSQYGGGAGTGYGGTNVGGDDYMPAQYRYQT